MVSSPLIAAAQVGDFAAVSSSLNDDLAGVFDCDEEGRTALHLAAAHGYMEIVSLLIGAGANVDQVDEERQAAPLHWAAVHGHLRIVAALLKAGADPNLCDKDGKTPLLYALDGFAEALTPWCGCVSPTRFYGSISLLLLQRATVG